MINVQLILDGRVIREYNFPSKTPFISIGRRPSHDICLDNIAVSGDHARLIFDQHHITLVDTKSSNGTLLNGIEVSRPTPLNPHDTIQIAKFQLKVSDERDSVNDISLKDPTTVVIPSMQEKLLETGIFSYKDFQQNEKENSKF